MNIGNEIKDMIFLELVKEKATEEEIEIFFRLFFSEFPEWIRKVYEESKK
jgi:hypothetical protein